MTNTKRITAQKITFKHWSRQSYAVFNTLKSEVRIASLALAVAAVMVPKDGKTQKKDSTDLHKVVDMEEVVVSAQREEVLYSDLARTVEVITSRDIQQLPVTTFDQLLEYALNADVRSRGAFGVQADVSLRAGSPDQVMILLNGINISNPQTAHHNLNLPVDLSAVKRVEILSGPASRVFGPNAFNGAINFITGAAEDSSLNISLTAGQHHLFNSTATSSFYTKNVKHFVASAFSLSEGYRENTDFIYGNLFYQGRWKPFKNQSISWQMGANAKQFGANSFYTPEYPDQFEAIRSSFGSLRYQINKQIKTDFKVYWNRHHDRFELFRHKAPSWYTGHNYHLAEVAGASVNFLLPLSNGRLSSGFEYRFEGIKSNVLGEPLNDSLLVPREDEAWFTHAKNRNNFSAYAEYSLQWQKFYFSSGIMANYNQDQPHHWAYFPGLDINYKISSKLQAYASMANGLRLPTFTELYYEGPVNKGNADLKPETSSTLEVGMRYFRKATKTNISLYQRWGENIIDWARKAEQEQWQTLNVNHLITRGLSIQSLVLLEDLMTVDYFTSLKIKYTMADQKKTTEEYISRYALDYLRHKLSFSLQMKMLKNFSANITTAWQDRAGEFIIYSDGAYGQSVSYDPFWMVDVKLQYSPKAWDFFIKVSNLCNTAYYDIGNIPQPGRWISAGLNFQLDFGA
ncbi:MAG: TonB-dependent receptor [Bacteroidales bacterium]